LASGKINFESIKRIVTENQSEIINVEQQKFNRNKATWAVTTSVIDKKYGFVFDKRVLFNDLTTLPYGY